jgi:hypothetical protein
MNFTPEQWVQLNVAASLGLFCFLLLYTAPVRWIVPALILVLPFQIISTGKYGSFNIYLIYLTAFVLGLRGHFRAFPYIGFVAFIAFAYAVSLSQAPPVTFREQLLYLFFVGANFLVFYIVYNYFRSYGDARSFLYLLLGLNGLILAYSAVQMVVGMNPDSPVFSGPISLRAPREDGRLTGPFGAVGLTSEYMVMAIFICGFMLLKMKPGPKLRSVLVLMMFGSFAAMIATANRGALFASVLGGIVFIVLFRRDLGVKGLLIALVGVPLIYALAAAVVINFTDFNRLFDRLAETEIEGGVPDTRGIWIDHVEQIIKKPYVGHGPRLSFSPEMHAKRGVPEDIPHPHNLYLFLLYTLGALGLAAYLAFWARLYRDYYRSSLQTHDDPVVDGMSRLGIVLLAVFLIDQMKIEFLRHNTTEYQHFLFMLWGALAALVAQKMERGQVRA